MKLIDRLKEYGESDFYAFHMPGHKRQEELGITLFPNPFLWISRRLTDLITCITRREF